uniref:Uncharacterized protein n=1 Tax=Meloidogyne hapla TaxID=6305 RepID=A0A1I8BML1_MELHA
MEVTILLTEVTILLMEIKAYFSGDDRQSDDSESQASDYVDQSFDYGSYTPDESQGFTSIDAKNNDTDDSVKNYESQNSSDRGYNSENETEESD